MIRKWNDSDLDKISQIWLETNLAAHDFIDKEYWHQQLPMVKELFPSAEIYVWEEKNQIYGFIGLMDHYVAGIFISGPSQGKRIGAHLLNYVKTTKTELHLKVYEKNEKAIKFYTREGFNRHMRSLDESTNEVEIEMRWIKDSPNSPIY